MSNRTDETQPHKSPWALLKTTFNEWMDDNALRLGASLAFYTVWSIGPLFLVVISVAGLFFGREAAQGQVMESLRSLVGDAGVTSIEETIAHANASGHTVLASAFGVASLLVAASGVFAELKSSLNLVWGVTPKPGSFLLTLKQRFLSMTMVLGTGFLLLVMLFVNAAWSAVAGHLRGSLPVAAGVGHVASATVSLGITALIFTLMFKVIPDAKIAWKDVWIGGFATAVLFTVGQVLIGLYLGKTSVGSAYGAASSLMIVVLWIFFSSSILFLGAELTQVYANMYGSRIKPAANALTVPRGVTPAAVTEAASADATTADAPAKVGASHA